MVYPPTERLKLLNLKITSKRERTNHTDRAPDMASQKLNLISRIYVTIKMQLIPPTIGTTVVASAATTVDCVHAIKNSPRRIVEGSPAINPPTLLPYLSAIMVPVVTQILPMIKDKKSFNKKMLSILQSITHFLRSILIIITLDIAVIEFPVLVGSFAEQPLKAIISGEYKKRP